MTNPENNFEYWKTGVFHFWVQDPNVEELAERIVAAGGKKRMEKPRYYPGEKPYRMIYMEDPFGNILEIYSHSYELIYSEGAYLRWPKVSGGFLRRKVFWINARSARCFAVEAKPYLASLA